MKYGIKLASRIIDNILLMIRTLSSDNQINHEFQCSSIAKDIEDALEIYPFLDHEKKLVTLDIKKDFTYHGNTILTKHLLFNLIKNSISSIKEAGKGEIQINLEKKETCNNIIFTDTALGIAKSDLKKIFDLFETNDKDNDRNKVGAGLGLAFCKMVMQSYGGNITCESTLGKHARFTLSFPLPQEQSAISEN